MHKNPRQRNVNMPQVSVIMPVYNVEAFVYDAVHSVLAQSYCDFELLIIDDESQDNSIARCRLFDDDRIRIIHHQRNRGLAAARNTGIRHAQGELLAFLDSDDVWHPHKLERHVEHLASNPDVGISFSRSAFINPDGSPNSCYQMPRLNNIDAGYLLCRNPVGNGSAPVIRNEVFDAIGRTIQHDDRRTTDYFDETLRQSEDIECWVRIALTTPWLIAGIPEPLTYYRLNAGGLSANLLKQLDSWEHVVALTKKYAPEFVDRWHSRARAYQLRYLARQAIRLKDPTVALSFARRAFATNPRILIEEPSRSLVTLAAALLLNVFSPSGYERVEHLARRLIGDIQKRRIDRDLALQSK